MISHQTNGFELSIINLQNYSGVEINIIRQMTASISRSENAEVQATVQVQKDAPAKLLIGTDLLPALGFILQMELEGEDVDLLKPQQARAEVNKSRQVDRTGRRSKQSRLTLSVAWYDSFRLQECLLDIRSC